MQASGNPGSVDERLQTIQDELLQGFKWERPCIVLAGYRSEMTRRQIQVRISRSLKDASIQAIDYVVTKEHFDIPLELRDHPLHSRVVFFVAGLRWGGGRGYSNAYRALNMHREHLVEAGIKTIVWMSMAESRQLTRHAPDFWAFRHLVVDFPELPPETKAPSPIELSKLVFQSFDQQLISDLSEAEQSFRTGCMDEAIHAYRRILHKYPGEPYPELRLVEIYCSTGRPLQSKREYRKLDKAATLPPVLNAELQHVQEMLKSCQPGEGGFSDWMG
jgi:hypothetical protein